MNDRKRQVLLGAQRLFVEYGYLNTSVQDIIKEVKISKGTFYNYFSTKSECLMAIVDNGKEEVDIRRRELLVGQRPSNKQIFIEQISIRQQINRDRNLLPLFEALFHSGDAELREFAKKHHLEELLWIAGRIVDIYGEAAKPYALDCAVLMFGMMQHLIHIKSIGNKEDINIKEIIAFTIRRIDTIIEDMIANAEQLFQQEELLAIEKKCIKDKITKSQLLGHLQSFQQITQENLEENAKQYVDFLVEELKNDSPRPFLLETVTKSLREALIDTEYEFEAQELSLQIGLYVSQ